MTGHGVSYGAVSVLNAIPCGVGSAIGIRLKIESFFEESDSVIVESTCMDDSLVSLCARRTMESLGKGKQGFKLRIESEIPPSIGLKSSSAVCNAVILSVLDFYRIHWNPLDVIKLGIECAKECGVTVTGAFDDACCCMFGGLVIADNNEDRLISQMTVPEYDVVICLPDGRIEKKDVDVGRYREHSATYRRLVPLIDTDYLTVMRENGRFVSEIVGNKALFDKAIDVSISAGVSGTGPALFMIVGKGEGNEIAKTFDCKTIVTRTRSRIMFDMKCVNGEIDVPASKSITHRTLVMAALSGKRCVIRNPLKSLDTVATIEALKSMGASITEKEDALIIESRGLHVPEGTLDVGNSGTTLRFITAVASVLDGTTTITGDASLRNRTVGPLLDALGIGYSNSGRPPVKVTGPIKKERFEIDGSMSSQFVSALLMIAPTIGKTVDIIVTGDRVSEPYVDMTARMMKEFGIDVTRTENGYRVEPGEYDGFDYTVPGDWSAAAYPLVAGALGGKVAVRGLHNDDIQGDRIIMDILRKVGCCISVNEENVTCEKDKLNAIDIDLSDSPDLFPILAVLLSVANGESRLYGAPHLRNKESDRIDTIVRMLTNLGADVVATDDGCVIRGVLRLKGGIVDHKGDHRIMMAAAVASIISEGPVSVDDDGCWNVSFPGFPEMMRSLER